MTLGAILTRRYALALALVAGVLLASHAVVLRQMVVRTEDGAVINRAGLQRMLSQRIALLALELTEETNPVAAARLAQSLADAVARMTENHDVLSAHPLTGSAARVALTDPDSLYFGRTRLDERIRRLLATAGTLLERHREGGVDAVRGDPLARRISSLALEGLLWDLDAVVHLYEDAFELGVREALRLGAVLLVIALVVLAFEARLIFHPMVRRVTETLCSLELANGRLREFVYLLSHDLRAPLASSRGLTSVMEESLADGDIEEARELAAMLDGSLRKMDVLIDNLGKVVRAGELDVVAESVDPRELIDEVVGSLSPAPDAKSPRIDIDVAFDGPVTVPREHLRSALESLVSNAIRYADPDEADPHLHLSVSRRERRVRIEVSDNGLGIPEPFRGQVFEMFKRFHPRVSDGSGLGLYLVRASMQAIGGRSDYEALPKGSRFSLVFDDGRTVPA